ncbi:Transmembrane protein 242 [Frankliniella fusca]|uniref:Transmembrane protein 242 n=1 Tax=Frankliniella fusca TaxID=407009 RepID=A0AAE1GZV1_9NEOP|nr:Transmembrane protein 242 [Frankliniella fusca]
MNSPEKPEDLSSINGGDIADGLTQAERDPNYAFKATAFLAGVAGFSAFFGFGATLAYAKKKDPIHFDKGVVMGPSLSESGAALALRALGWGTVYAVGGCGILFFSLWKLSGCNNLHEFRIKMGEKLPKIRRNDPPQSRTEFDGLSDLMRYLETWGSEKKIKSVTQQNAVEAKVPSNTN